MVMLGTNITIAIEYANMNDIAEATDDNVLVDHMLESIGRSICLDQSRALFLQDALETLVQLVQGKLFGRNRYRRVLLGRKSVGKTWLLNALFDCARSFLPNRLVCVRLQYDILLGAVSPFEAIISELGLWWKIWWNCQKCYTRSDRMLYKLEEALKVNKIYVFGIIDELNEVYTAACPNGEKIIDEVFAIGNSAAGVMHWIICGNSKNLRQLVSAKLPSPIRNQYANYKNRDLNDTKFVPMQIFPFLGAQEFRDLVTFHCKGNLLSDKEICDLYFKSGGLPGIVSDAIGRKHITFDSYLNTYKGYGSIPSTDASRLVMRSIFSVIVAQNKSPPEDDPLATFSQWTDYVMLDVVKRKLNDESIVLSDLDLLTVCYSLSDRGILRFQDQYPPRVSLGSPVIFRELWHDDVTPTVEDLVALRTGNKGVTDSRFDLAGDFCLRCIGHRARAPPTPFGFTTDDAVIYSGIETLPVLKIGGADDAFCQYEHIFGRIFKEGLCHEGKMFIKDALGCDGVVLVKSGVDSVVAHRIQVKIYGGNIDEEEATKICNIFCRNEECSLDSYRSLMPKINTWEFRYVIASIANFLPGALSIFEQGKVTVWDHSFLARYVWPDSIKALGKRFRQ